MFIVALQALVPTPPVISGSALGSTSVQINLVTPSVEPQTGIAYYILQQLVHGSGLFFYQTIATLQANQFPYIITGLAQGTTYQFQLLGVDNSAQSDVSQPSAPVMIVTASPPPPPPPSGSIPWVTGHQTLSDGYDAANQSEMNLAAASVAKSYTTLWHWNVLEGPSLGQYNFQTTLVPAVNAWLKTSEASSKYCGAFLSTRSFNSGTTTATSDVRNAGIPLYILTDTNGSGGTNQYGPGPSGSIYGGWCLNNATGSKNSSGQNLYYTPSSAIYRTKVMARKIALHAALAATPLVTTTGPYAGVTGYTFNTHPQFAFIIDGDESSFNVGPDTPSDWTVAQFLNQSQTFNAAMAGIWTQTNWITSTNWPQFPGGTTADVETIVAQVYAGRGVFSGPDIETPGNNTSGTGGTPNINTDAQQIYIGNKWNAGPPATWTQGAGPNYIGTSTVSNMPCMPQVQDPDYLRGGGQTPANIYNVCQVLGANGIFWTIVSGSNYPTADFATKLAPFMAANNNFKTALPLAYNSTPAFNFYISPSGSDTNPGTLASPWSINAINTKQSTYAGKSVGVIGGNYNINAICLALGTGSSQTAALAVNGGTSGSPTYIASCNSTGTYAPRLAIISGGYPTNPCGMIGQGGGNPPPVLGNVILDGLVVTQGFQYGINFYLNGTIVPTRPQGNGGATGIVVKNCEVAFINGQVDNNVGGIFMQNITGAQILNNLVHDIQPTTGGNATDVAGIFSYFSYSNVYQGNTGYNVNQLFRDKGATGDEGPNGNHTLLYNYAEINGLFPTGGLGDGNGGSLGDTYTVHHNIFNVIGAGAALWYSNIWPANASTFTGQSFYQNTCIFPDGQNGAFLPAGGTNVSPTANVNHYGNVYKCAGTPDYQGVITVISGAVQLTDFNLYGVPDGYFGISAYGSVGTPSLKTLAQWQSATGGDAHSQLGSPTFVAPTTLNPAGFALVAGTLGSASSSTRPGRVGGVVGGALTDMGAWGVDVNTGKAPTQIGCGFKTVL